MFLALEAFCYVWLYDKCWGVCEKRIFLMTINDLTNVRFDTFFSIRAGASGTRVSMNPIHMKILHLQKSKLETNSPLCLKYV